MPDDRDTSWYQQYLCYMQSPEWRIKRLAALTEWRYQCVLHAQHGGPLEVHHRTYARLGHEDRDDLVPLCMDCHEVFHQRLAAARRQSRWT